MTMMFLIIQIALALCALGAKADILVGVDEAIRPRHYIAVLDALKNTNIALTLGIRNEDLPAMAAAVEPVNTWFKTYVEPYLNDIVFKHKYSCRSSRRLG
ncbi:hypothetical protein K1719_006196 [Acacia pycnantha]|nr:hypothetical protein K1719_006196 [Acacia pycnantha]